MLLRKNFKFVLCKKNNTWFLTSYTLALLINSTIAIAELWENYNKICTNILIPVLKHWSWVTHLVHRVLHNFCLLKMIFTTYFSDAMSIEDQTTNYFNIFIGSLRGYVWTQSPWVIVYWVLLCVGGMHANIFVDYYEHCDIF